MYVSVMCACACRYTYAKGYERHVQHAYVNVYMCGATGTGTHPGGKARVRRWVTHVGVADTGARSQGQMELWINVFTNIILSS